MTTHAEHHYVPKFLLKGWECGSDQKLSAFRWIQGRVLEKRFKAKSVAKERNLYTIQKTGVDGNQSLERDFMSNLVDDPAAQVHQLIVSNGLDGLTSEQRHTWSIFLTSLMARGPGSIDLMRSIGVKALNKYLDENPSEMLAERGPQPEASLRHFVEKNDPRLFEDFGLMNLPNYIQNSIFNKLFFTAHWQIRRLQPSSQKLLISDRPLTLIGAIKGNFLIYLPLTPDLAFIAFDIEKIGKSFQAANSSMFIKSMNKAIVKQASQYVFGVDDAHLPLIERRLEKSSTGPGLALGPRLPKEV